ncbi:MAG: hypothetical protein ACJARU_001155 [Congregibacter sp.]|jgi:hypothetical protein
MAAELAACDSLQREPYSQQFVLQRRVSALGFAILCQIASTERKSVHPPLTLELGELRHYMPDFLSQKPPLWEEIPLMLLS